MFKTKLSTMNLTFIKPLNNIEFAYPKSSYSFVSVLNNSDEKAT
jgi:hypothetical protein